MKSLVCLAGWWREVLLAALVGTGREGQGQGSEKANARLGFVCTGSCRCPQAGGLLSTSALGLVTA